MRSTGSSPRTRAEDRAWAEVDSDKDVCVEVAVSPVAPGHCPLRDRSGDVDGLKLVEAPTFSEHQDPAAV
jgi:hypothetical protein